MTPPGGASVMPTYARYPVTLVRGEGLRVWDDTGRTYLDMLGGLGALSLGHCHPRWVEAVEAAARTIGLTSNLVATPPQAELAHELARLLPIPDARVFFCNSGAEASEAAIKLAAEARAPAGQADDRGVGGLLPRQDPRRARGHRSARQTGAVRAARGLVPLRGAGRHRGARAPPSRPATSRACSSSRSSARAG